MVESYSDNNGNWYRVYKSGWIEQGIVINKTTESVTVNLLKQTRTLYSISPTTVRTVATCFIWNIRDMSESSFLFRCVQTDGVIVKGNFLLVVTGQSV